MYEGSTGHTFGSALESATPPPQGAAEKRPASRSKRQAATILLVDDERPSASILAKLLRQDGFEVQLAFDGASAIVELSRRPQVDMLITDLRMPHADGLAIARHARSLAPNIPVCFVTGYPQFIDRPSTRLEPKPEIFTKPLDYVLFSRAIRRHLGEP